jgi:hypothetical protein
MQWNEGGYSLVPFNGVATGSWDAGGYDEVSFGGLPEGGWGSAGFGEIAFDATPATPIEPEKPKIPDSIKWGIGQWVTPIRIQPKKSKIRLRNEALLFAAIL